MNSISQRRLICVFILFVLVSNCSALRGVGLTGTLTYDNVSTELWSDKMLKGGRLLGDTITTPNCNKIRTVRYPAELQIFYTYTVEINNDLLLSDMERAIDNAVAIELDMCDVNGYPVYKVRTSTTHSFSTSGKCDPIIADNTCIVVNGETAVLLDKNSDATFVTNKVYIGIAHGLGDLDFLNGFTNSVVTAALISEGHASLIENSNHHQDSSRAPYHSGVTATVAVAAASVSILIASIFFYGFMRRPHSHDPSVRHRNHSFRKPIQRAMISGSHLGVPMRRRFVRLEDLSSSPTSFVTASLSPHSYPQTFEENVCEYVQECREEEYCNDDHCNPAINWSISDITSDSASLRSGVSRTPSMLERIDEEIEDEEDISGGSDDSSCNFSYSEDSTIITNVLSRATITGRCDCHSVADDQCLIHHNKNVDEFDCASERQDRVLDISDLDPCFTILPEDTDEIFRDLEDLSSEGTQDSPLESVILEMRMSTEFSDGDSDETAISDTSIISLVPLEKLTELGILREGLQNVGIEPNCSDDSEDATLESTESAADDLALSDDCKLISQREKKEENTLLFANADKISSRAIDTTAYIEEGDGKIASISISKSSLSEEDDVDSTSKTDDSLSDTDSGEAMFASEVECKIDDESSLDGSLCIPFDSGSEIKQSVQIIEKSLDADICTSKNESIGSISVCSIKNHELRDTNQYSVESDECFGTKIVAVDSIDEWASNLLNGKS